jgi:trehalose-phosphatase
VALLLDYDGTLAPIAPHPDLASVPLETKNVLQRLSNMPDVYISIISGRSVENVMQMVMSCLFLLVLGNNTQFGWICLNYIDVM